MTVIVMSRSDQVVCDRRATLPPSAASSQLGVKPAASFWYFMVVQC